MTSEQETLWLAGLLEGEGHFNCHYSATVKLAMTDRDVVERASIIMGCKVHCYPSRRVNSNRKAVFECTIHGDRAAEICKRILPFMGQRRKSKIEELLIWNAKKQKPSYEERKEWGKVGAAKRWNKIHVITGTEG